MLPPRVASRVLVDVVGALAFVVAASLALLLTAALLIISVTEAFLWLPALLVLQGWMAGYMLVAVAAYGTFVLLERRLLVSGHPA